MPRVSTGTTCQSNSAATRPVSRTRWRKTRSRLRDVETEQVAFRKGLVKLGRICGYEIIDGVMETEYVTVETPLTETTGEHVKGLDNVVIINVLRAATPFVEGLLKAFPRAKQGVISAGRDEEAGMDDDGEFPITVDYVKLPEITENDTVIIADPMLATGSTMATVLDYIPRRRQSRRTCLFWPQSPRQRVSSVFRRRSRTRRHQRRYRRRTRRGRVHRSGARRRR